jgi:hypothetical protein
MAGVRRVHFVGAVTCTCLGLAGKRVTKHAAIGAVVPANVGLRRFAANPTYAFAEGSDPVSAIR